NFSQSFAISFQSADIKYFFKVNNCIERSTNTQQLALQKLGWKNWAKQYIFNQQQNLG
ncbi:MAG: hypothetical protein JWQ09_3189, partial [Segetibacter sp.]|nr:hypothetical protein [Segetibacter sp.]